MTLLTIAIPTFNRIHILKKNLEIILPQITNDCELLIIDNCSDDSIKKELDQLQQSYSYLNINILVNERNIGGDLNTIKCLEKASGKYVWIIGDDDKPKNNCINELIKLIIDKNDTSIFFLGKTKKNISNNFILPSEYFLSSLVSLDQSIFISNYIYRRSDCVFNLPQAYLTAFTCCPQLFIAVLILRNNNNTFYNHSYEPFIETGLARSQEDQSYFINTVIRLYLSSHIFWLEDEWKIYKKILKGNWILLVGIKSIKANINFLMHSKTLLRKEILYKFNLLKNVSRMRDFVNLHFIIYKLIIILFYLSPSFLFKVLKIGEFLIRRYKNLK